MNWSAVTFDWNQVRAFWATAEEGSFSGAARVLRSTQPTIGRQISALEASLGVTLVERSVRGLSLTQAGRELLDHVRAMGEAATLISMSADGQSQEISGDVVVTATDLLSAAALPQILAPLRETAPGIRVRVQCSNEVQNLMQREADIAIRHVRPDQPDLIARHLGDFGASLYAARSYLDRVGRPSSPHDTARLDFVGNADPVRLVAPLQHMGIPVREDNFVVSTDSGAVAWAMTKAGLGASMQPEALGEDEPGLERVLPSLPPVMFPMWLVTHRELKTNRRIRLVFDHLAQHLTEKLTPRPGT
ncbi:DNA-binding transcriptional LysR family regulator [Rubricella aquisinus]|uniref:DNA-binding transcriptional LysR family regulator n=1 Tax=Rubricella aquisinus TaxID=2028108 RepID=A0A840WZ75_9RHOB|nr:LysR family transcriptional regulator [Rubricella aquisinus]MBB5514975.1 DNA-binding transcriptional LysR family regulator [Rubricella aquisinus]